MSFLQEPFNTPVGTYNSFQHPMGGGPPPELPTSPPTYESVSDRTLNKHVPHPPTPPPSQQVDRQTDGEGESLREGPFIRLARSFVCLPHFLHPISEWAWFVQMNVPSS